MFSRLAVRVRPLYLVVVSAVGVAVINLFVPILTLPAAVVALMVLLGVFSSQYDPATVTVLSNLLRSGERDVGIAAWVTVSALAGWAVAPLLGSLGDAAGLSAVFIVSACAGLIAVAALMFWGRKAAGRPDAPDELAEMYG
jgi:sugar phosphate permease